MANFGFTVTSLIEIWIPAGTGRFHKGTFSFLDRMVLFLSSLALVFFFYQGLVPPFDFSMSKDFSIGKDLPGVNFVECAGNIIKFELSSNKRKIDFFGH